ncbi:hypothetical protein OG333_01935 [Streptomyces anulatus]|uniref:hypothetical protein n=1 Tax=Streptomyces anulatus TaxID=1892 RepID=UPI003864065E|nr:hypothetical protein OG333_01935 [Streptomyces anulatus]
MARYNDEIGHQAAFAGFESGADTIMDNLVAATTVNTDRPLSINRGAAHASSTSGRRWRSPVLLWSRAGEPGKWAFERLLERPAAQPELDLVVMDGYSQAACGEAASRRTYAARCAPAGASAPSRPERDRSAAARRSRPHCRPRLAGRSVLGAVVAS